MHADLYNHPLKIVLAAWPALAKESGNMESSDAMNQAKKNSGKFRH
jgi:hypothetical protein